MYVTHLFVSLNEVRKCNSYSVYLVGQPHCSKCVNYIVILVDHVCLVHL